MSVARLRPETGFVSASAWIIGHGRGLARTSETSEEDALYDDRFASLFESYVDMGGMAKDAVIAKDLVFSPALGTDKLSRWISERKVLSASWNGVHWLPIFQFEEPGAIPCRHLVTIIREMSLTRSDLAIVEWFCEPNLWLDHRVPAVVLHDDGLAVLHAARADCLVLSR